MNLLAVRAADAPLLLTFEDLEWSDPATMALIGNLARRVPVLGRICVACTWRQGYAPIAIAPPHLTLELQRLPRAGVLSLLARSPSGGCLSDHDRRQIAELSEGVPLLAVELARLCSSGHGLGNGDALLESLGPVLLPRLDALRSLKPLARAAALLGRRLEARTLAAVLEMDEAGLLPKLDALVELGFLRPAGGKARGYRLAQPLIGKVAYASLLKSRRRRLHQRAGEVLGSDPATAERRPDSVARHFAKAGDFAAAFTWWRKAGERAARASAVRKSVEYFREALNCRIEDAHAGSEEEEAEVSRLLAVQLVALKGNGAPEVVSALQHSIDLSPCGKQDPFDALWALHASYLVRGEIVRALQIGEDLMHCAGPGAPEHKRIRVHRVQGLANLLAGCLPEAFAHYRLALGLYDEARHSYLRFHYASDQGAISYAQIAWGEAIAAEYERSATHARMALDLSSRLRHPHTSAHVACVLGARAHALGDRTTAAAMAYAGRTLGERYEFPYWISWADLLLGWVEGERGSGAGADRIERALEAYQRTGACQALPFGQLLLAETLLAAGQPEAARAAALHGVQLAQHYGLRLYLTELLRVEAKARLAFRASAENANTRLRRRLGGAGPGRANIGGAGGMARAGALSDDRIVQESDTLMP
jgi:tetratricopeptide (TPR) repeat protein